jgi:hypothetical protein
MPTYRNGKTLLEPSSVVAMPTLKSSWDQLAQLLQLSVAQQRLLAVTAQLQLSQQPQQQTLLLVTLLLWLV